VTFIKEKKKCQITIKKFACQSIIIIFYQYNDFLSSMIMLFFVNSFLIFFDINRTTFRSH